MRSGPHAPAMSAKAAVAAVIIARCRVLRLGRRSFFLYDGMS
jgi:hypothetical protein